MFLLNQFWNLRRKSVGQKFNWHHFGFVKNRKIFHNIWQSKNAWKTNVNGPPTLLLEFKTQISGTRYYLRPFCFNKRSWNITNFLTIQKTPWKLSESSKLFSLISFGVWDRNCLNKSDIFLFLGKKIIKYYKVLHHLWNAWKSN